MDGQRRLIQLVSAIVEDLPDGLHRARVQLWRRGRSATSGEKYLGTSEAVDALRAAAEATINALRQALPEATRLERVVSVESLEALGTKLVGVAISGYYGGEARLLQGFFRVRGYETAGATAGAVLDATNRFLDAR
jgi:hypothetical protein